MRSFFISLFTLALMAAPAIGMADTTFTYQGRLDHSGAVHNGTANMDFRLYDAATGGTLLDEITRAGVPVNDGLFQVELDFGAVFDGGPRWLEIRVDGLALTPRQPLRAAPLAIHAMSGGDGSPWTINSDSLEYPGRVVIGSTFNYADLKLSVVNADEGLHALRARTSRTDGWGVWGQAITASNDARGVFGQATATSGATKGVYAHTNSPDGYAVYATGSGASRNYFQRQVNIGANFSNSPTGSMLGVRTDTDERLWAATFSNTNSTYTGIHGGIHVSSDGANNTRAIEASAVNGFAVFGIAETSGRRGVVGQASGTGSYGVFANGNLGASGTKSFQIDHPLDPANQYLMHFAAEGPEPYNVYSGTVALDDHGKSVVELPAWFDHINRDFRYQLTAVGAPAPHLHVAEEIADNQFLVAGGEPGMKVSWQVTAVRDDPHMRAHPVVAELPKPVQERGKYLHPQAYGKTASDSLFHAEAIE